jgi:hypothetical protein
LFEQVRSVNKEFVMSAGSTVGKFIGNTAAYAVHGAAVAVNATGKFGADVVSSTGEQYTAKSAELQARREAVLAGQPAVKVQRKLKAAAV